MEINWKAKEVTVDHDGEAFKYDIQDRKEDKASTEA